MTSLRTLLFMLPAIALTVSGCASENEKREVGWTCTSGDTCPSGFSCLKNGPSARGADSAVCNIQSCTMACHSDSDCAGLLRTANATECLTCEDSYPCGFGSVCTNHCLVL